ncbi:winged helix-turn-helix transcriptional regulator [Pelagibius litoralis]|uniref:Winged helix-turn-helix transcriptional regulator n=1 Tax=Pelagibius litoralis TaxID=374515 RepID=A0A967F1M5_9PROT|nr:metalloregulator ArsR/SmtB family transcription factor [Pelagibius litoralis]NIA71420.1 winged helix-turn-helix transcriptional regulator [Pelagibius litoralis]
MAVKPARKLPAGSSGETDSLDAEGIAMLAKALAHPARVKVVDTLLRRRSCIGCDIVEEIGLAASTTSEHLRILKEAGLIVGEIARPRVCYSLNPEAVAPLRAFLQLVEAAPAPAFSE